MSGSRNNGWAAAWTSLITAAHWTLVPPHPPLVWLLVKQPLGGQASASVHLCGSSPYPGKRSSSSPRTQSIHIKFKQVEPISSSLPTVSASGKHSIHTLHAAPCFMPWSRGSSALKDTRTGVNWLCDDNYGLIMVRGWKTSWDHLQTEFL